MAVYFQFKSSTVRDSVPIDGHFISVGELKYKIAEIKQLLGRGRRNSDSQIVISEYESKEDYLDDSAYIPRFTTVWARRAPVQASVPIVVTPPPVDVEPELPEVVEVDPDDLAWDEVVDVINGKPETETVPLKSGNVSANPPSEVDEDSKIKALVETPALGWQGYGGGGGGGGGGFGWKTPPPGYVCHRCREVGHFIQHCPTNGNPAYDKKRFMPPAAIPNEAAFVKEMEGVSSSSRSSGGQLPPELHCRLCKQVMKDAVLTSRCCFNSFCDGCIRGHIISKSSCVCGATNVLAVHLIPNLTLRNTISRILDSSSGEGGKQGVVDSKCEIVSVKESAPAASPETAPLPDEAVQQKPVSDEPPTKMKALPVEDVQQKPVSDEPPTKKTALPVEPAVQQKPVSIEPPKKKKALPVGPAAEKNMMSVDHNQYWGGMQAGMNAFMPPYAGYGYGYGYGYGPYGYGQMNMPFWGGQNMMYPGPGFNAAPPEVRKADGKRKRDDESAPKDTSSLKLRSSDRTFHDAELSRPSRKQLDHSHCRDERDHSRRSSSHHSSEYRADRKKDIPREEAALKKRKLSSSSSHSHNEHKPASASSRRSSTPAAYDEGSDDDEDRNFKRRSSWTKSSAAATRERQNHSARIQRRG